MLGSILLAAGCTSSSPIGAHPTPPTVTGPTVPGGSLAFDQATGEMVLVDPSGAGIWTWDGLHAWRHIETASAPATQRIKMGGSPFGLAWDPDTASLVAVIGDIVLATNQSQVAMTWLWNAGAWTRLDNSNTPAVIGGAIGYYPAARQLVMFSGCCVVTQISGGVLSQSAKPGMWSWDGYTWRVLRPVHMPPARWGAAMVYDPTIARLVMYGGMTIEPNHLGLNDMWAWDGTDWTQMAVPSLEGQSQVTNLAYSPDGSLLLTAADPSQTAATWRWSGGAWTKLDATTPVCYFCELAYDPVHKLTVMATNPLGNPTAVDAVWVWNGITWSQRS